MATTPHTSPITAGWPQWVILVAVLTAILLLMLMVSG